MHDDMWFWIIKLLPTTNYLCEFNSAGDDHSDEEAGKEGNTH